MLQTTRSLLTSHLIGVILTTVFYGVTLAQTCVYYRTYTNDSRYMKFLVALLWFLDTSQFVLVTYSVYHYTVRRRGDPIALLYVTEPFLASMAVTSVVAFIVQLIYANRIWRLSFNNICLTSSIIILALIAFGSGGAMIIKTIRDPSWDHTSGSNLPASLILVSTVACDILIAAAQVFLFHRHKLIRPRFHPRRPPSTSTNVTVNADADLGERSMGIDVGRKDAARWSGGSGGVGVAGLWGSGARSAVEVDQEGGQGAAEYGRLGALLTKLTVLVVNVGLLTSIDAMIFLILFLACPRNGMFLVPYLLLSNCYINSFLSILNSRQVLRELVDNHEIHASFFDIPLRPQP